MSHIYICVCVYTHTHTHFVSLNISYKDTVYYFLTKIYDMPSDFSFEYNCPFIWFWIVKYFCYLQILLDFHGGEGDFYVIPVIIKRFP